MAASQSLTISALPYLRNRKHVKENFTNLRRRLNDFSTST
jgi:hypothetical protein